MKGNRPKDAVLCGCSAKEITSLPEPSGNGWLWMSKSNNKWVYEPWHPLEILAMKSFVVPCSQEPRSHLQGICSLTLRVQITIWKGAKKQCVGIVVLSKTINLFLYTGIHLWVPFTYIKKRKLHDHRTWNWMRPSKYAIGTSNPELRTWTKSQDNSPQFKTSFLLGLLGLPSWNSWIFPYGTSQNISNPCPAQHPITVWRDQWLNHPSSPECFG